MRGRTRLKSRGREKERYREGKAAPENSKNNSFLAAQGRYLQAALASTGPLRPELGWVSSQYFWIFRLSFSVSLDLSLPIALPRFEDLTATVDGW